MFKYKPPKNIQSKIPKEWMKDELLKDWIAAVVGDDTKAFCKFCKCVLKLNIKI